MRITLFVSLLKVCFMVLIVIGLASTAACSPPTSRESPANQPSSNPTTGSNTVQQSNSDNSTKNGESSSASADSNKSEIASGESAPQRTGGELTAKELASMLTSDERLVLIDVNPIAQYNEGHIKGAIWGDSKLLRTETEAYLNRLGIKKTDAIVLVCEIGNRSANTVPFLDKAGYQEVYNLKEGNLGWIRAGFDLIRE